MVECVGKSYSICNQIVRVFDGYDVKARVGKKYIYIEFNDLKIKMEVRPRNKLEPILNEIVKFIDAVIDVDISGDIPPKAYEL